MAFEIAELYATISARDAQIQSALPALQKKLKAVQRSMERVSRIARRMFLVMAGAIALTVKQASDAEEAHNKFMTVFRAEGQAVSDWAVSYGKAVGRAQVDMERYLGTIQDTLVPMGMQRTEATKLSKSLVTLALDLASFNDEADADVLRNLQSALVGQTRAVLKYGVVINEAAIKQELLNMGISKSFAAVTTQEKVQARINVLFRSTTDAQGDLIRTQGSFQNQLKALISSFKDMNAQIGQAFIPNAIRMMRIIRDLMPKIGQWVTHNKGVTAGLTSVLMSVLGVTAALPLLLGALDAIAAHPIVALLLLLATQFARVAVQIRAAGAAARDAAALGVDSRMTEGALQSRLAAQQQHAESLKGEIADAWWVGGRKGALKAELEGTETAITETTTALRALGDEQERINKLQKEWDAADLLAGQKEWAAMQTRMAQSLLSDRERAVAALKEEIALMEKVAKRAGLLTEEQHRIEQYFGEHMAMLKKKWRDEDHAAALKAYDDIKAEADARAGKIDKLARERMAEQEGGARAGGFTGIAAFGKRLQESILRKSEDDRRDALLKKLTTQAEKDIEIQDDIKDAILKLAPSLQMVT